MSNDIEAAFEQWWATKVEPGGSIAAGPLHREAFRAGYGTSARELEAARERLKRWQVFHLDTCNTYLDDESDAVLGDFQVCTCGARALVAELEATRNDAKQKREELAEVIAEFGQFKRETSEQRSDFYNRLEAARRENKTRSLWYGDHHPQCEKQYSREGSTQDCLKFGCFVDAALAAEQGADPHTPEERRAINEQWEGITDAE